ncbi:NADH-quinone oxidoreductase subunit L [bacterium]|nr:NADH-quinone oxidoreductase subunit L [bacterium]
MVVLRFLILAPLAAALLNLFFGRWWGKKTTAALACGSVFLSFCGALRNAYAIQIHSLPAQRVIVDEIFTWIAVGRTVIRMDLVQDNLTCVMCLIITGVGFLIHLYSVGYMAHDGGFRRYFIYLNLFVFFMLLLVLADNLLVLFIGWEGVGLCSYLLIGFWHADMKNASAGKKAFVVNRIGDFGFLLGMLVILLTAGTLSVTELKSAVALQPIASGTATLICLLLFLGAAGKSAQIPLYTWLPDAMAGPTPVSALIHAATMVTAGVYMIARLHFLYALSPLASGVVAAVGAATAIFAAVIGLAQNDIKKVLAYSTVSQLGYMFLAVGVGAYTWGIFHLTTHAFFKALLFLGAGSVIHGLSGEQNLQKMGGLRKHLPVTFVTMLAGTLAIAGVPPLAGFFSKDEILVAARLAEPAVWSGRVLSGIGLAAAFLTAFYMGRLLCLAFFGSSRVEKEKAAHLHESPWTMTVPLMILAILSAIAGFGHHHFSEWLAPLFGHAAPTPADIHDRVMWASVAVALAGLGLSALFYIRSPGIPARIAAGLGGLYRLVADKFYVDELYDRMAVKAVYWTGVLSHAFDKHVIDRLVNWTGGSLRAGGFVISFLQTGNVGHYAIWFLAGVSALLVLFTGGAP